MFHPAATSAGGRNLVQMSRSLSLFLSNGGMARNLIDRPAVGETSAALTGLYMF